ncbi:hypothetical protein C7R57_03495 [Macrococcoides caseolyticum subsp. caseolyticum]|uniref:hypothetical protein n=2 Tax=Macrococcoides caseolyticum TaxID=69966 RepID=UPI000C336F50|nr:hypothetical protein [Macrococcus caseolyticus]PKE07090.1 hypothetical protein CW692_04790 [Macrococcus caseolyticus]PKE12796.1 hypothetical protein CW685_01945 [Macrococcus caseolyticus]PKE24147.1 hypothetical protein CW689_05375 [Macrococcus caseolyticus]PNZ72089.1 hypothetical protein CD152_08340 [Macrococcus caseolyticus]QPT45691.1 hypothetical protein I6G25_05485 [Macrococcus caseolyticus]
MNFHSTSRSVETKNMREREAREKVDALYKDTNPIFDEVNEQLEMFSKDLLRRLYKRDYTAGEVSNVLSLQKRLAYSEGNKAKHKVISIAEEIHDAHLMLLKTGSLLDEIK